MFARPFAILCSFLALSQLAFADISAVSPPPGILPQGEDQLRALDAQQSGIVRRAERICAVDHGWSGGAAFRACVISLADNAVATSGSPQLQAYHRALPYPARYSSQRVGPRWSAWQVR